MTSKVKQGFECINEELGWKRLPGASHWRKDFGGVIVDCWNTTGKARVLKIGKGIKVPFICSEGMVCSGVEALQLMANAAYEESMARRKDEGCPQHGTVHVCVNAERDGYPKDSVPLHGMQRRYTKHCRIETSRECGCSFGQCLKGNIF